MKYRKPHIYRATGHWWITFGGYFSRGLAAHELRRAMFGEAL